MCKDIGLTAIGSRNTLIQRLNDSKEESDTQTNTTNTNNIIDDLLFDSTEMEALLSFTCTKLANIDLNKIDDENLFQEAPDSNI